MSWSYSATVSCPIASAENLRLDQSAGIGGEAPPHVAIAGELGHGVGQGRNIAHGHGERGLAIDGDLATARRIGRHHGAPAGGRLEQAFRQPLAAGGEHGEMAARPHLPDIGDMAEPLNAVEAGEFAELLGRKRTRILLVAIAGEQQLERDAALAEQTKGLDQRDHAFVGQHASDIGGGYRRWRLGQWRAAVLCRRRSPE